ncbi:hypothetical protein ATCV1_z105L [Acanthocystis turfacea chlorella virus 1]|uniref:Uncharacterized protein z105L n=1 Tax=Chlorovirus heliozoae TaxID=322019 RepID=A7K865_9PHYC|nr:hypothetical protein ATCV1_z105L [Acanthocystis turfacea chlorella virus 1]ABT16239.1 hypothetical protein ATCV1_z105L [Acanthocystis turfacea chlorella virus 1]
MCLLSSCRSPWEYRSFPSLKRWETRKLTRESIAAQCTTPLKYPNVDIKSQNVVGYPLAHIDATVIKQ